MAYNYARAANSALKSITKYGRAITLLKSSATPADVAEPWKGSDAPHTEVDPTTATAKAVFVGLTLAELGWTETNEPGDLLKKGAQYALVAPSGILPVDATRDLTTFDAIKDATQVWAIRQIHVLKPGDVELLYAIEVTQ